ncbi:CidA/LrgA family protein [Xenophilus sp. AP218F]|nr:CidA/LrgA family protein [Xenophilus sp. AP218F]
MLELLLCLLGLQLAGEWLARALDWPVPGPVAGMVLLFAALWLRRGVPEMLKRETPRFLGHMSLLFIPAGGALLAYGDLLGRQGWQLLFTLLASSVATLLATGGLLRFFLRRRREPGR